MFVGRNRSEERKVRVAGGVLGTNVPKACSRLSFELCHGCGECSEGGGFMPASRDAYVCCVPCFRALPRGENYVGHHRILFRDSDSCLPRATDYDFLTVFFIHVKLSDYGKQNLFFLYLCFPAFWCGD